MSSTHPQQITITPNDDPTRAAVENLIASIKSKQLQEAQRQSDRKILDIIHRVLGRTIDLVYDEDEKEQIQQEYEQKLIAEEEKRIPMILEEEDMSVNLRVPDVSRMDLEVDDEKYEGEDGEYEDITDKERTLRTKKQTEDYEQIDMSRDPLYRHILLGITDEDILNVRGTQINVPTSLISRNQAIPTKPAKHDDKSAHRFCIQTTNESDILSKEVRAITQLYHQRARYRNKLPTSTIYYKHGQLPKSFIKEPIENAQHEDEQNISRSIKTNGPSIPYDGLESGDTDLNVWQRRATQIVQPKIEGNSAISQDPYLIHLWTPAPPKMYIHPPRKDVKPEIITSGTVPSGETHLISSQIIEVSTVKEQQESVVEEKVEQSSGDFQYFRKTHHAVHYEDAVADGRRFISSARIRATRRSRKDVRFWQRIDAIVALATAPPRDPPISRRQSFHEAYFYERNHPHSMKEKFRKRRTSLEKEKLNFDKNIKTKYKYEETRTKFGGKRLLNEFEWTREVWYNWLDEYIAELDKVETMRQETEIKQQISASTLLDESSTLVIEDSENEVSVSQIKKVSTSVQLEPIINLQVPYSEERRLIEDELYRLTKLIDRDPRDVFSLTRRGGLLRKLGLFHDALNDLSLAVYIEPSFMDAYWQRALIYMIFEHYDDALDSLNMCIKFNKTHAGAYKLRGDIYSMRNDLALAIANYSQAIRHNQTDHEAYFQRAQTYERRNEILLAMDDYVQVTQLNPKNIEAWYKHAMYYFNTNNYDYAIGDFTELLKRQSDHVAARLYRGLSYFYLEYYQNALADFSATLHYDPSNWAAYYHRGCLLRTCNPAKSLKDLSISLLINPEYENVGAYLHRALIYCKQNQHDAAIADYEAVLVLDREHAPALCNLAIIYMRTNIQKALQLFTRAIEAEPTTLDQSVELHGAYLDLSKCLIQLQRYPQAVEQLTTLIKLQPPDQNAEAYLQRGIAKMRMFGKFSTQELTKLSSNRRPLLDINRALVIEPNSAEAYLARAAWYARCERYSKGVLNCNEAIRLSPKLVRAYLYRGCLKYSIRLYDHAIKDLSIALDIDPSCSHAYYNRALCYIRRGNLSLALKDFAIVLCLASAIKNSKTQLLELETYINRGLLQYEHKDFENALIDFEYALEIVTASNDERRINALKHKLIYTIGQCHHRLAQFDEAIERFNSSEIAYHTMTDTAYRHDVWIAQGIVYMDMGNDESKLQATKLFESVLHENPIHETARLNLGYCFRQRGYYKRAWIQFSALLHFNPSNARALEARAIVCLQMNHPTEAFIDLNQALRFQPSSAQLLTNRGVVQQYLGDNKNAMCDYRAAMLADPNNAFAHYNAGNILMFHGQFVEAITLFDRVLEINPRDEAALTNRAIAKVVLKQYSGARNDLEHALRISPLSAHIHIDLGQLLLTMNEPIEAEKHFTRALEIRPCDPAVYKWRGDALSKQDGRRQDALDNYRACVELSDALQLARKHGLIKAPTKTRRRL
ncbi:unnamed protein product, partial [Rotaria magnacalcarata]